MDVKVLLIVDDDRDDRYFFRNAVKEIDPAIECQEAPDGLEALIQLRNSKILPDFIFLDLNMPGMNGKQCLAELKKDARLASIPVIIYSTSDFWKDIEETSKLGAAYYLIKTWDISKLPGMLVHAMEKASKIQ